MELKGWYALAKEGEPSFRYKVAPEKCRSQDLIAVYPWVPEQVLAGQPILLPPFIEEAKYAAQLRDYYWLVERNTKDSSSGILEAKEATPNGGSRAKYSNHAASDKGTNFGRLARGKNVMVDFVAQTKKQPLCGIEVGAWQLFFELCAGGNVPKDLEKRLAKIVGQSDTSKGALALLKEELSRTLDNLFSSKPD